MSRARKIASLRALAESTTFPAEKASALELARKLEAMGPDPADDREEPEGQEWFMWGPGFPSFEEAIAGNWRNQLMEMQALASAMMDLDAEAWADPESNELRFLVPGVGPSLSKKELIELHLKRKGIAA